MKQDIVVVTIPEVVGHYDIYKIAAFFGWAMETLAFICGVSESTLLAEGATDKEIQSKMAILSEIAMGVLWPGGEERFREWLVVPNSDFPVFKGRLLSPLGMIEMGHMRVVADKVKNIIHGVPG